MAEVEERQFTRISANIGGPASPIRRDHYDGKEYIVAPMAILAEGVLVGGDGEPTYYPDEEVGRNPASWNHKPFVAGHPMVNGKHVPACDPATLERQGLGLIFNSTKDDKLRCEAWIDPIKAAIVEPRVLENLDNGVVMEVSTGLFAANYKTPGKFNEKDYTRVAKNYQPDHVALLLDSVGAYSIEDGGGLLQINEDTRIDRVEFLHNRKWTEAERHALPEEDFGDPKKRLYPIKSQEDVNSAKHLIGKAGNPDQVKKRIIEIAKRKGLNIPAEWHHGVTTNEASTIGNSTDMLSSTDTSKVVKMSHSNLRRALGDKLRTIKGTDKSKTGTASAPSDNYQGYTYVEDVYDDYFIYSDTDGKLYKQGYSQDGTDVNLKGKATPAKRVTEYRDAVSNAYIGNSYTQVSLRELESMTVKTNEAGNVQVIPPVAGGAAAPNTNAGGQTTETTTIPAAVTTNSTQDNTGQTLMSTSGSGGTPPSILKPSAAPATSVVNRETMANELINGGAWNNTDKSWLVGLDEDTFTRIYKAAKTTTVAAATAAGGAATKTSDNIGSDGTATGNGSGPVTNQQGATTLTTNNNGGSILNNNTPAATVPVVTGYQFTQADLDFLANGRRKIEEDREFLIVNISKHPKFAFTEAYLREKDVQGQPKRTQEELIGMARMLDLPTSKEQLMANAGGAYAGLGLGSFAPNSVLQTNQAQMEDLVNPKDPVPTLPFVANESPEAKKKRLERLAAGGPLLERQQSNGRK